MQEQLVCQVREHRTHAGLSQSELAALVGVSRQALSAIETGRQTPSTTLALNLARALRCSVEDLFRLSGGPQVQAVAPRELDLDERVLLGRVDGVTVAHPLDDTDRAADGLVRNASDRSHRHVVEVLGPSKSLDTHVLVAGCAPLLGVLSDRLGRRHRDSRAIWIPSGSGNSLDYLERGLVHIAGVHLADSSDIDTHARLAAKALPGTEITICNLARWTQGLLLAPGNPLSIRDISDLGRPDVRAVRRGSDSAAQQLLVRLLEGQGESEDDVTFVHTAGSHDEVARVVRWGLADVGVGIESAALRHGLAFVPLAEERFDLVLPESRLDFAPADQLLSLIDNPAFRSEAGSFPGYDLSEAGHATSVARTS